MKCGFCGGDCYWQNDFDAQDLGYDKDGVVSFWTCSNCRAEWEGTLLDEGDEDI